MKKINIFVIVLLLVVCSLFLISKNNSLNATKLDEVVLIEEKEKENSMFSIMLGDREGNYTSSNDNKWPVDGYIFNNEKSGCIDYNGKIINNSLYFNDENKAITISTNTTAYCYLYFDLFSGLTGDDFVIKYSGINGLSDVKVGGMYRYQGSSEEVTNNYVCFGTADVTKCINNPDAYMYRIIGITAEEDIAMGLEIGQYKLIKKESLNSAYQWYSNDNENIAWSNSYLYSEINQSAFLTNSAYMTSEWSNKIDKINWKYGDNPTRNAIADSIYTIEHAWTSTITAKVGLMYLHDYYFQGGADLNCSNSGAYSTCKLGWMHLWQSGNDINVPNSTYEWTMTRYGNADGDYGALAVISYGYVNYHVLYGQGAVRPVFYLNPDVAITDGTGIISNPFILK